jgi:hypothetical protein
VAASDALIVASRFKSAKRQQSTLRRLAPSPSVILVALLIIPVFPLSIFENPQCHPGPGVSDQLAALSSSSSRNTTTKLLNRRESSTGLITVSENLINGEWSRLLRCDHSLLGGLWIGPARRAIAKDSGVARIESVEMDAKAIERAESVYATFLIQEAVRLVDRSPEAGGGSQKQAALVMLVAHLLARVY